MRRSFALFAVVGVGLACSDLKRADDANVDPNGGGDDSGAANDGSTTDGAPSDAAIDVGQPPVDFECSEYWTKATKAKTECAPRQVKEIDEGAPDMDDVSIARTSTGRVAIAFYAPNTPDDGETRFFHFIPTTAAFTPEKIVRPSLSFGHQPGYHVKVSASAPDTVHILAHDVFDSTGGDLVAMRFVNGMKPLTDPEVVVSALQARTEIALAADPSGNVIATARLRTGVTDAGKETAKLVARRKAVGGAFTALPDVVSDLSPDDAPGVGAASLLFDGAGKPNLLFHHCESQSGSQPRHHTFDGTQWSPKKTVDNSSLDGNSGFSPRLAVYGNKKIAAFFYRKDLQGGTSTADLRVITWAATTDTLNIKIVDQGYSSADEMFPRYRMAMAVDKYGLTHLAVIAPATESKATLDYWRETPVDGGGTKWLRDIVDPDVLSADQGAAVDLVVDENARAHIVYRSGVDFKVRYATRYDR